jgi:hypothetical protein
MWNLWWRKLYWGRFPPRTDVSLANHSTDWSAHIIHHHPGVVQQDLFAPNIGLSCTPTQKGKNMSRIKSVVTAAKSRM